MKIMTLNELYIDQLQDMHNAESQLTKALPKMSAAASDPDLKLAFDEHLEVTRQQLERVERLLVGLGAKPGRKKCEAMIGLVKESEELIHEEAEEHVRDAGLIVAAQKVEHYEIAAYGSLRAFAEMLGRMSDAEVLEQTLEEEREADESLTDLAMRVVNPRALNV